MAMTFKLPFLMPSCTALHVLVSRLRTCPALHSSDRARVEGAVIRPAGPPRLQTRPSERGGLRHAARVHDVAVFWLPEPGGSGRRQLSPAVAPGARPCRTVPSPPWGRAGRPADLPGGDGDGDGDAALSTAAPGCPGPAP